MHSEKNKNKLSQEGISHLKDTESFIFLKRALERDFISNVSIEQHCNAVGHIDLIIHIDCNFRLTESLFFLKNGNWGNFQKNVTQFGNQQSSFQAAFEQLRLDCDAQVELKELSIHFQDTSIIISQLPNAPIEESLYGILKTVHENYVIISDGLSKKPYEIFIPVHEHIDENSYSEVESNKTTNYLKFWGLYFDLQDNEDQIFDVKNKEVIESSRCTLINQ